MPDLRSGSQIVWNRNTAVMPEVENISPQSNLHMNIIKIIIIKSDP